MPAKGRSLWVPALLVSGLALAIFLGSRGGSDVISDHPQFAKELQALQRDAVPLLDEIDKAGGEPDDEQAKRLESFHPRLERLLRYRQDSIAASFLAGKVNVALRNHLTAEKWLRQSIENAKPHMAQPEVADTVYEAHRILSELYLRQQEYDLALIEAELALKGHPNSPDYRVARASALIQLNRVAEARKDLQTALRLDPQHGRANGLLQFLEAGS